MSSQQLGHKTVRPGSFINYGYYHHAKVEDTPKKTKKHFGRWLIAAVCLAAAFFLLTNHTASGPKPNLASKSQANNIVKPPPKAPIAATTPTNYCAGNNLGELIKVSISLRQLWACQGTSLAYQSAVVTGDENYADTLTPLGTYHIYAKETDTTLTGSSSLGSWHDYVYYWMPFLYNQYGAYGFHDATWRPANAFGQISPYSSNASNGCVELPLATAKWLYSWDHVGTTVQIVS